MPRTFRDGELLQKSIRTVSRNLSSSTIGTRSDILLDEPVDARPCVLSAEQF